LQVFLEVEQEIYWMHLLNHFQPEPTQEEVELPRFAVVGRPNAGNQVLSMP
jgi:hypothetical protein